MEGSAKQDRPRRKSRGAEAPSATPSESPEGEEDSLEPASGSETDSATSGASEGGSARTPGVRRGRGRGRARGRGRGRSRGSIDYDTDAALDLEERVRGQRRGRGRGRGRRRGLSAGLSRARSFDSEDSTFGFEPIKFYEDISDRWGTTSGDEDIEREDFPVEVLLERSADGQSILAPSRALGFVAAAYNILRAFSWQIRLSPVPFEEICAAIFLPQPSDLADELFMCILRTLAQDENRAARAARALDLDMLDAVTWPEFLWEWLRLSFNPLSRHHNYRLPRQANTTAEAAASGNLERAAVQAAEVELPTTSENTVPELHESSATAIHSSGEGCITETCQEDQGCTLAPEWELEWSCLRSSGPPPGIQALMKREPLLRSERADFHALPSETKAEILMTVCNDLLDTRPVRFEIDRRETAGQIISGKGGEGGAFPMRSAEERRKRLGLEPVADGEVEAERAPAGDGNLDLCVLCSSGGSLLCCDGCPAAYHMRCIGETGRNLPEGEWLCPECALGGRGESAGLRIPLAGLNGAGEHHHLSHGRLFRGACGRRSGRGRKADEDRSPPLMLHEAEDAVERLKDLEYPDAYEDDGYVLSSAETLSASLPRVGPLVSAEAYLNRYKNGWTASYLAAKQFFDECAKRRGRPSFAGGLPLVPLAELPVPVPISNFAWPQSPGKGNPRPLSQCGKCSHCLQPSLRRACLSPPPGPRDDGEDAAPAKLALLANALLRLEREWWGVMQGGWTVYTSKNHRQAWAGRVRTAQTVAQLTQPLLELEAALRPIALDPDWDPARRSCLPKAASQPLSNGMPATQAPPKQAPIRLATRPPSRWVDPDTLPKGRGRGRQSRKRAAPDSEGDESQEEDEEDPLVENTVTKRFANWAVSYRSHWARWAGRHSLPAAVVKKEARRGGRSRIKGVKYSSRQPAVEPRLVWQAACQAAHTAGELALQLRVLDAQLEWDATKAPPTNDPVAHAQILGKRLSEQGSGWEYLVNVPAHPQGRDLVSGSRRVRSSAKANDRAASAGPSRFAPGIRPLLPDSLAAPLAAALGRFLPPLPASKDSAVMQTPPSLPKIWSSPGELTPSLQGSILQPVWQNGSAAAFSLGSRGAQILAPQMSLGGRDVLSTEEGSASETEDSGPVEVPVVLSTEVVQPGSVPSALELSLMGPASGAAAGQSVPEDGTVIDGAKQTAVGEAADGAPKLGTLQLRHGSPSTAILPREPEPPGPTSPAALVLPAEDEAAGAEQTGMRKAGQLLEAATPGKGDLPNGIGQVESSAPSDASQGPDKREASLASTLEGPSIRAKLRSAVSAAAAVSPTAVPSAGPERKPSPAQKPVSPSQALLLLAGREPEWILESRLPLWLVKGFEDQLRRESALSLALAAQQAAKEAALEDEARARAAEIEAAKVAVAAAAASCGACDRGWGEASSKDALWVSCDVCHRWFHGECAGVDQDMLDILEEDDHWECDQCWKNRTAPRRQAVEKLRKKGAKAAPRVSTTDAEASAPEAAAPKKAGKAHARGKGRKQPEPEGDNQVLYCTCMRPDDGSFEFVCCDECEQWFHPECVGTTLQEVEEQSFVCPLCVRNKKKKSRATKSEGRAASLAGACAAEADAQKPSMHPRLLQLQADEEPEQNLRSSLHVSIDSAKPASVHRAKGAAGRATEDTAAHKTAVKLAAKDDMPLASWVQAAVKIVDALLKKSFAKPFEHPVTDDIAPGYSTIITNPMDISIVRSKLMRGEYSEAPLAYQDLLLIWENCRTYNEEPHDILAMCSKAERHLAKMWSQSGLAFKKAEDQSQCEPVQGTNRKPEPEKADSGVSQEAAKRRKLKIVLNRPSDRRARSGRGAEPPSGPEQLAAAAKLIRRVAQSEFGQPFAQPVTDQEAPDYADYVRNPMDLGTILDRMDAGQYASCDAVLRDVDLVWSNCRTYNTVADSYVLKACDGAERMLLSSWADAGLSAAPQEGGLPVQQRRDPEEPTPAQQVPDKRKGAERTDLKLEGTLTHTSRQATKGPQASLVKSEGPLKIVENAPKRRRLRGILAKDARNGPTTSPALDPFQGPSPKRRKGNKETRRSSKEASPKPSNSVEAAVDREGLHTAEAAASEPRHSDGIVGVDDPLSGAERASDGPRAPMSPGKARAHGDFAVALRVIRGVARTDAGRPFAQPVSRTDAADYANVIRRPMDLGTIAEKIQASRYSALGEILDDVNLVWANCRGYNPIGSLILEDCRAAQQALQERWLLAGLPSEKLLDEIDAATVFKRREKSQRVSKASKRNSAKLVRDSPIKVKLKRSEGLANGELTAAEGADVPGRQAGDADLPAEAAPTRLRRPARRSSNQPCIEKDAKVLSPKAKQGGGNPVQQSKPGGNKRERSGSCEPVVPHSAKKQARIVPAKAEPGSPDGGSKSKKRLSRPSPEAARSQKASDGENQGGSKRGKNKRKRSGPSQGPPEPSTTPGSVHMTVKSRASGKRSRAKR